MFGLLALGSEALSCAFVIDLVNIEFARPAKFSGVSDFANLTAVRLTFALRVKTFTTNFKIASKKDPNLLGR